MSPFGRLLSSEDPATAAALERETRLTRYLLGSLPDAERDDLEQELFVDDELNEELAATTDDVLHAYLSGQLGPEDHRRVQEHVLASPRARDRLEFMRTLLAGIARDAPSDQPAAHGSLARRWVPWAAAAAVVVGLAAGFEALRPNIGEPPATVASVDLPDPIAASSIAPAATPAARATPAAAARATLVPPGKRPSTRSEAVQAARIDRTGPERVHIALASGAQRVRLEVMLPEDGAPTYDLSLRRERGEEVFRRSGLTPRDFGEPLVVEVPVEVLTPADYALVVEAGVTRGPRGGRVLERRLRVTRRN